MTAEIPPVVPERRQNWHTPDGCFKLLDVQAAMDRILHRLKEGDDRMDSIFGHLEANDVRMGCMEDHIAGNHRVVCDDMKDLKTELKENSQKTDRIFEIVEMGEGLFKGVKFTGKLVRRIIMWFGPPVSVILGIWYVIRPPK